jgi:hypothetical protein
VGLSNIVFRQVRSQSFQHYLLAGLASAGRPLFRRAAAPTSTAATAATAIVSGCISIVVISSSALRRRRRRRAAVIIILGAGAFIVVLVASLVAAFTPTVRTAGATTDVEFSSRWRCLAHVFKQSTHQYVLSESALPNSELWFTMRRTLSSWRAAAPVAVAVAGRRSGSVIVEIISLRWLILSVAVRWSWRTATRTIRGHVYCRGEVRENAR